MAKWEVKVYTRTGDLLADLTSRGLVRRLDRIRNRADTITLRYDLDDFKRLCVALNTSAAVLLASGQNEIRLFRNGVPVSAGRIWEKYPIIDDDQRTIDIKAVGWLDLLGKRFTAQTNTNYTATDAGEIAMALIDYTQAKTNGDIGITEGVIQPSKVRDRNYVLKNIKEAIIQLSEVIDGFDFEFTWDKKFNVYYPKQGQRKNIILNYPGEIRKVAAGEFSAKLANSVIARGAGTGEDSFKATAEDTVSQAKFGLMEDVVDFSDVSEADTLQEHADEELNTKKSFIIVPDIRLDPLKAPPFGSYNVGDEVQLRLRKDQEIFGLINDWFRIDAISLELDENDVEDVRLSFMR